MNEIVNNTLKLLLDMRMDDPLPTFTYLVTELAARHPNLAYLHLVEPRISGDEDAREATQREVRLYYEIRFTSFILKLS